MDNTFYSKQLKQTGINLLQYKLLRAVVVVDAFAESVLCSADDGFTLVTRTLRYRVNILLGSEISLLFHLLPRQLEVSLRFVE
jgi:hypothetical protein